MKLVSYLVDGHDQLAVLVDGFLYDMETIHPDLPNSINMFLNYWDDFLAVAQAGEIAIQEGNISKERGIPYNSVEIIAPVPFPPSCRDGYAFYQHVATARRNRGAQMIAEFEQYPVFYFTNHHSIQGSGDIKCMPDHFEKLDFELRPLLLSASMEEIFAQKMQMNILPD